MKRPSPAQRLLTYATVYLPWALVYESVIWRGKPPGFWYGNLAVESSWPVWEWTELFYAATYPFAFLIPWMIPTVKTLRAFSRDIWISTVVIGLVYYFLPMAAYQQPFIPTGILGEMILWERAQDGEMAAFPSFHVIWAFLAARYYSLALPRWKAGWYLLAVCIALSCLTTHSHSIPDVVAGVVWVYLLSLIRKYCY